MHTHVRIECESNVVDVLTCTESSHIHNIHHLRASRVRMQHDKYYFLVYLWQDNALGLSVTYSKRENVWMTYNLRSCSNNASQPNSLPNSHKTQDTCVPGWKRVPEGYRDLLGSLYKWYSMYSVLGAAQLFLINIFYAAFIGQFDRQLN